jgi:hypothetical protein
MNFVMKVGAIQEVVSVTDTAAQVDLASSSVSEVVSSAEVRELPLNGRDWASLAALQPGVAPVRTQLAQNHVGAGGRGLGSQLTVGGARPTQNSYRLDGIVMNDYSNAGPGSVLGANLGVDAIQEFSVITTNYSAEYGFTSGGVINAISRSGTNQLHGTLFNFLRNDVLDAANYFEDYNHLPKGHFEQNQFGGALGWRILKDRLFFFGDYEGVRQAEAVAHSNDITISDAVRNGTVTNNNTGATTTVQIDPTIQKFLALFPHPTPSQPCVQLPSKACNPNIGRFVFDGSQKANEDFYTARGDYHLSASDAFSATYVHDNSVLTAPLTFNAVIQQQTSFREAAIVQETHTFKNNIVNAVRVGWDDTQNQGGQTTAFLTAAAGDPTLGMAPGFFAPSVTLTGSQVPTSASAICGGYKWSACGASVQEFWGSIMQVYDDLFITKGNHGIKFGFDAMGYELNAFVPLASGNGTGTFTYQGTYPTVGGSTFVPTAQEAPCLKTGGNAANGNTGFDQSCGTFVNFLTNQPRAATRFIDLSVVTKHYLRDKVFAGYVEDDWRIRPHLTLNLGLRYEMSTIPTEINGRIGNLPSIYTQMPTAPTSDAQNLAVLQKTFFTSNPTTKNFEPRVGFAWDVFGTGKTALRGGWGLFDSLPLPYELILNNNSSAPFRPTYATLGPNPGVLPSPAPGSWPYAVPTQDSQRVIDPTTRNWNYVEPNPQRNYVMQYNLNIEHQLSPNLTITVGYAGARGYHSPFQDDSADSILPVNVTHPIPGADNSAADKPISGVGYYWSPSWNGNLSTAAEHALLLNPTCCSAQMYSTMWISQNWYDSLQVRVNKNMSRSFQVGGSFTWAKSLDDSSGSAAGDTFQLDPPTEPWWDLSLDKGPSSFNIAKNLTVNSLWDVPGIKSHGRFVNGLTNGFEMGLILSTTTGVPIPLLMDSTDLLGEFITTVNPPNLASGCQVGDLINHNYRSNLQYINTKCVSLVPQTPTNTPYCDTSRFPGFCPNIRGNIQRNTLIGPGYFNTDYALYKNTRFRGLSEDMNLQFRAEMFNILNHTNFAPTSNNTAFSNGQPQIFGNETSTQGQNRQIQIALKLIF